MKGTERADYKKYFPMAVVSKIRGQVCKVRSKRGNLERVFFIQKVVEAGIFTTHKNHLDKHLNA